MNNRSLINNSIIYSVKVIMGMLTPLITFPYCSRILNASGIGAVTYANSIIIYFVLVASLGINSYAIREGSKIKDNTQELNRFVSEIFTINCISAFVSYLLFLVVCFLAHKLNSYRLLLLILSIQIALQPFTMEWFFNIFEDYLYITIRTIIIQLISILYLFICVKSPNDVALYCLFIVLTNSGSSLYNFILAKRRCYFKFVLDKRIMIHLSPILILFLATIASQVYVNSDTTMLGYMINDTEVGLYTAASKIYSMIRNMIGAFITVSIPRISYKINKKEEYLPLLRKVIDSLGMLTIPASIGGCIISYQIVSIISGSEFYSAGFTLKILFLALPFSVFGSITSMCILLPNKKENQIFVATVIGAIINIGLNIIIIPLFFKNGAAVTTVISELIVFWIQYFFARKVCQFKIISRSIIEVMLATFIMAIVCSCFSTLKINLYCKTMTIVCAGGLVYFVVLLFLKNYIVLDVKNKLICKFLQNKNRHSQGQTQCH